MATKADVKEAEEEGRLLGMRDAAAIVAKEFPAAAQRINEMALGYALSVLGNELPAAEQ